MMRHSINRFSQPLRILIIIILLVNSIGIVSANSEIHERKSSQTITRGLEYEYISKFTEDGWADIHVLKLDLEDEYLSLEVLRAMDEVGLKKTLSDLADEEISEGTFVGGVNGSFFNMSGDISEPLGAYYDEAFGYADQHQNRDGNTGGVSLIQGIDESVFFDFFGVSIAFHNAEGRMLYLTGINRLHELEGPSLYNRLFGEDTSRLDALGDFYKLVIEDEVVTQVVGPEQSVVIPELDRGYIISVPDSIHEVHLPHFEVGQGIDLELDARLDPETIKLSITGGGRILENGVLVEEGLIIEPNKRHPRTAMGITADGKTLVAMVVDGRGESIGATHAEMAQYLLEQNVSDAIHFDGGGSSTMMTRLPSEVESEVVNEPSDGSQRRIINGIGFYSTAPEGQVERLEIVVSSDRVFKNNPVGIQVIAFDEYSNPVQIDTRKILWSVEGLIGTWGTESFTPMNAGKGNMTCYYEDLSAKVTLNSLDDPIDLSVTPRILTLDNYKEGTFYVQGVDNSGFEGDINPRDVFFELENPEIGYFDNGVFYANGTKGISKVTISSGSRETSAYVVVGTEKTALEAFETTAYHERSYPEELVSGTITEVSDVFYDTDMSYRLDYQFTAGPDSQAFYLMLDEFTLENETDEIQLAVFGDNSGHKIKGLIFDDEGNKFSLTFTENLDYEGWQVLTAKLSDDMVYPVKLDRLYVVALQTINDYSGTIYFDSLVAENAIKTDHLRFDEEGFINDPMMLDMKPFNDTSIRVFGATAHRNRLLDNVIMDRVYDVMNEADYGVFAGNSDVDSSRMNVGFTVWDDSYQTTSVSGIKLITLGTSEGGLRETDASQYLRLENELANAYESGIVIVGNKNPLTGFDDQREGDLLHSILSDYVARTGKSVVYVSASGYETDVTLKDGVRYIDTSGLWYQIQDRYVDLNSTFFSVDFYLLGGQLMYRLEPLYSLVEIEY